MLRKLCLLALAVFVCVHAKIAFGFGSTGHALIGAIADERLVGTPTQTKLTTLLNGMSLERAATLADEIKTIHAPFNPNQFSLESQFKDLQDELIDFALSNSNHRDFHFTDVPVEGNSTYKSGTIGRTNIDIAHTIPFCIGVINETIPETNAKKITKRVAVVLLAHYLGDLHQPLHVGSQYFTTQGAPTNPDTNGGTGFSDQGGNKLMLHLTTPQGSSSSRKFHSYWDDDSVELAKTKIFAAMRVANPSLTGVISNQQMVSFLAKQVPTVTITPASIDPKELVISWIDEMVKVSRDAHSRLDYSGIHILPSNFAAGSATPKSNSGDYNNFTGETIQRHLPLAGARVEAILVKYLK